MSAEVQRKPALQRRVDPVAAAVPDRVHAGETTSAAPAPAQPTHEPLNTSLQVRVRASCCLKQTSPCAAGSIGFRRHPGADGMWGRSFELEPSLRAKGSVAPISAFRRLDAGLGGAGDQRAGGGEGAGVGVGVVEPSGHSMTSWPPLVTTFIPHSPILCLRSFSSRVRASRSLTSSALSCS